MAKEFNVEGVCIPEYHYMVNIDEQLCEIKGLVDKGKYFTINRARQYGKTTTLNALKKKLDDQYTVFFISFEGIENEAFADGVTFCRRFFGLLYDTINYGEVTEISENIKQEIHHISSDRSIQPDFRMMQQMIFKMCQQLSKPIVLIIDEVDQASNYNVFDTFLGSLRDMYLKRMQRKTFHSVVLAGVYDIRNLREKIRTKEEHSTNSPWNIAARFSVDMSFPAVGIEGMLKEYEKDYHTGMDTTQIATMIYEYTSGYPFLVSEICKILDEHVSGSSDYPDRKSAWTKSGFLMAVRVLLSEQNTLFESLIGKLKSYPNLNGMIYQMLFMGKSIIYNPDNQDIAQASMFGFIKNKKGNLIIANRIFETRLYNLYLSSENLQNSGIYTASLQEKNQFTQNGKLNMKLILEKFVRHFHEIYGDCNETFLEEDGRKYFLLYLRPIINGTGNYYIESRTRDMRRTDVIVDYLGTQYIIELKIWHGDEYNKRGEHQLAEYLDDYGQKTGYLLSFNFNKKKNIGIKTIKAGNKVLVEAVV
jgi:hypothetical protein